MCVVGPTGAATTEVQNHVAQVKKPRQNVLLVTDAVRPRDSKNQKQEIAALRGEGDHRSEDIERKNNERGREN